MNDVIVKMTGGKTSSVTTNSTGFYGFNNLESNLNYMTHPVKANPKRFENDVNTMSSAALTSRHAVGVETLSANGQISADVDKDGQVLAYDAALIARYSVKLPQLGNDHVGEWQFSPNNRN